MANAHRRRNSILRIKIDGNWLFEKRALKAGIVGAFQKLLTENGDWWPSCEGLYFKVLEVSEASWLEFKFSEEGVLKALTDLNGDKASGPDGFTMAFWQDNWGMLKEEVFVFLYRLFSAWKICEESKCHSFGACSKKRGCRGAERFQTSQFGVQPL